MTCSQCQNRQGEYNANCLQCSALWVLHLFKRHRYQAMVNRSKAYGHDLNSLKDMVKKIYKEQQHNDSDH